MIGMADCDLGAGGMEAVPLMLLPQEKHLPDLRVRCAESAESVFDELYKAN
jgi:hypothetical protein